MLHSEVRHSQVASSGDNHLLKCCKIDHMIYMIYSFIILTIIGIFCFNILMWNDKYFQYHIYNVCLFDSVPLALYFLVSYFYKYCVVSTVERQY